MGKMVDLDKVLNIIDSENELDGEMPDDIYGKFLTLTLGWDTKSRIQYSATLGVRSTKQSIRLRLLKELS